MFICKICEFQTENQGVYRNHCKAHLAKENKDKVYDFSKITPKEYPSFEHLKLKIRELLNIHRPFSVREVEKNLEVYAGILYFNSNPSKIKETIVHIFNDNSGSICKKCGVKHFRLDKKGNWQNWAYHDMCSMKCITSLSNTLKSKESYLKAGKSIWESRKKNGKVFPTAEAKKKMSEKARCVEVLSKKRKTCKEKYGFENPGILGGRFSKSGELFIRNFIKENNLDEKLCYFANGGVNGKEYFLSCKKEKGLSEFYLYDLVVINEKKEIVLVLEYNGMFHYTMKQVTESPNAKGVPYKNSSKTIKDIYEKEIRKLDAIKKKCDNILIYWPEYKTLEKYDKESLLLRTT